MAAASFVVAQLCLMLVTVTAVFVTCVPIQNTVNFAVFIVHKAITAIRGRFFTLLM